jgi:hypothetical protein
MSGMTPHSNPLDIAKQSWEMSKKEPNDRVFKLLTIGMLALTGLSTMVHAARTLWRDVKASRREHERGRPEDARPLPPEVLREHRDIAIDEATQPGRATSTGKQWTRSAQLADRVPHDDHAQAARVYEDGQVRQR